jgi:hypothetical protein
MPIVSTLYDVNVLLALVTDRHASHTTAVHWFDNVLSGSASAHVRTARFLLPDDLPEAGETPRPQAASQECRHENHEQST